MSSTTDVVVTGLGATTPLGGDVASSWDALLAGRSGVSRITDDWATDFPAQLVARLAAEEGLRVLAWRDVPTTEDGLGKAVLASMPMIRQCFVGRGDTDWGAIMAASVIYTVPVALVFIVLRKHLMQGTMAGAVKG